MEIDIVIKAVLFDMDGILFDSEKFYYDGNYNHLVGLGYTGEKEALLDGVGRTLDGIVDLFYELLNHTVSKEEIRRTNDAYYDSHPICVKDLMFDHIPEMVKKLHDDGYKLACCSSSAFNEIEYSLKEMGIRKYFDFIESSEKIAHPKPAGDIYELASAALGVSKDECIVYEDSDKGIAAGKNAGMKVIAVEDDFSETMKEEKEQLADRLIHDFYEVL